MPLPQSPRTSDSALPLDPRTYDRALACVHCGLCLPACPTYTETGHEADSPRGRIQLMRGLADGIIDPTESVRHHLDLCLDCRACESACPSGVVYHELIEETRSHFAGQGHEQVRNRLLRWMLFHVVTHPTRLKLALLPVRLMQKIGVYGLLRRAILPLLPPSVRRLDELLPPTGSLWPARLVSRGLGVSPMRAARPHNEAEDRSAEAHRRDTHATERAIRSLGFFPGCVGSVMYADVNRKAVDLLEAAGADVVVPRSQACCGAIHHHNGCHTDAIELARRNIDAFCPVDGPGVDAIITAIAGCGAMLRDYGTLLRDDPHYAERALLFASRVRDVSEVLLDLGLPDMTSPIRESITYHDACHLAHAQRVVDPPRLLLSTVPGLKIVPLPESDMCCGAAGTYNLTQPMMAKRLADRKLEHIARTGATTVAAGNIGCAMHLATQARARKQALRIVHPVEILHRAVFGPQRGAGPAT